MDKKRIELIRKFNKLNRERKSLYWEINNLNDDFYQVRVELRKKFSQLKMIFEKYKKNKELLNNEVLENLENNLIKFKKYIDYKIEKELEKID